MSSHLHKKANRKTIIFFSLFTAFVIAYELFLWVSSSAAPASPSPSAVHFLDVGQGDCALIVSGEDAILIDAGITAMSERVIQYLKEVGVSQLTAAIGTHAHEDHIGGMAAVLRTFPTETLYLPGQIASTRSYEAMLEAAEDMGTKVQIPSPGQILQFGENASMTFFSPPIDSVYENINDSSIISLFSQSGKRILFTGDAESPAESHLLAMRPDLSCDVLKIAHHGSDTSSTDAFLDAAQPSIAVISCGKFNDYGHPHPETISKLNDRGIQIHCTAEEGTYIYPIINQEGENIA